MGYSCRKERRGKGRVEMEGVYVCISLSTARNYPHTATLHSALTSVIMITAGHRTISGQISLLSTQFAYDQ